ncbi:hypothetical protein MMC13_000549 [Lambiella insularis]|nr:hypothetical protein [Lambiella insularis]
MPYSLALDEVVASMGGSEHGVVDVSGGDAAVSEGLLSGDEVTASRLGCKDEVAEAADGDATVFEGIPSPLYLLAIKEVGVSEVGAAGLEKALDVIEGKETKLEVVLDHIELPEAVVPSFTVL